MLSLEPASAGAFHVFQRKLKATGSLLVDAAVCSDDSLDDDGADHLQHVSDMLSMH
jgi:hypothetical protein